MGETKTLHFYDFGIFEPVTKPQNQLFLLLETPGYLNKSRQFLGICSTNITFVNLGIWKIQNVDNFQKDGHRTMMKIRVTKSPQYWTCISYLSKT